MQAKLEILPDALGIIFFWQLYYANTIELYCLKLVLWYISSDMHCETAGTSFEIYHLLNFVRI